MFFPRLRRQVKWMFVLLAVLFAGGYVLFDIGGTGTGGFGDLIQNPGAAGLDVSADEAREKIRKNPQNAIAYRELATALQAEQKEEGAIAALETYTRLRPRDADAARELASLYLRKADRYREEAQLAQLEYADVLAISTFRPPANTKIGQALGEDPFSREIGALVNDRVSRSYSRMQQAYQRAVDVYRGLAALSPRDATVQFELAQAAEQAGDAQTALAAWRKFIRLAPDDQTVPAIKERIAQLEQQVRPPPKD